MREREHRWEKKIITKNRDSLPCFKQQQQQQQKKRKKKTLHHSRIECEVWWWWSLPLLPLAFPNGPRAPPRPTPPNAETTSGSGGHANPSAGNGPSVLY